MENAGGGVPFYDLRQTRLYPLFSDFHHISAERYPVGFMDLLGVHRHCLTHTPSMHFPTTTPNSSSSDAVNDDHEKKRENEEEEEEEEDGEEQQHKTYKREYRFNITKSTSEKTKLKVPKVSFITKSEVLNLDDGYKWRKYGQKPVRNSPFPRNYYRCTTTWCDVKKRVERSFSDPSSVITTYEGQHSHPRPVPKGYSLGFSGSDCRAHFGLPTLPPQLLDYNNHQQQGQSSFGAEYIIRQEKGSDDDHDYDHVVKKSRTQDLLDGAGSVKEHGLLQDVVSSRIIKEKC